MHNNQSSALQTHKKKNIQKKRKQKKTNEKATIQNLNYDL